MKRTLGYIALALVLLVLLTLGRGHARELLSLTREFGILRDFTHQTIGNGDRVFFDADRFVVTRESAATNRELRQIAIAGLKRKFHLVERKQDANVLVPIRMEQRPNYSIGNRYGAPSHGFVMISTCKYPIRTVSEDCENLQYDYFRERGATEVFSTVFDRWLKAVVAADRETHDAR